MQQVRDIMTGNPVVCPATTTLAEAARVMRERDIGDVLVADEGRLCGIVTDRDIVVRGVARGADVASASVASVMSPALVAVSASSSIDDTAALMRDHALRRMPVVEEDRVVGIVSLGDLAREASPGSVLADIASAGPNL